MIRIKKPINAQPRQKPSLADLGRIGAEWFEETLKELDEPFYVPDSEYAWED